MPTASEPLVLPPRTFSAARAAVAGGPVLLGWFGTLVFSTGPVMTAATSVSGPAFSFWRLWIGSVRCAVLATAPHRRRRRSGGVLVTVAGLRWMSLAGVAF